MNLKTRFFGEVEIDENKVIIFDEGIPGFENLKRFLYMIDKDENSPFCWLQSIEDTDIVFTLLDIYMIMQDYNPIVSKELIEDIGTFDKGDLLIYTIVNIPDDIKNISVNLKAPIVINMNNNKAKQIISTNEEYEIRTYIYDKLRGSDK